MATFQLCDIGYHFLLHRAPLGLFTASWAVGGMPSSHTACVSLCCSACKPAKDGVVACGQASASSTCCTRPCCRVEHLAKLAANCWLALSPESQQSSAMDMRAGVDSCRGKAASPDAAAEAFLLRCPHMLSLPVKTGILPWLQPHRCIYSAETVLPSAQGPAMRWPSVHIPPCKASL